MSPEYPRQIGLFSYKKVLHPGRTARRAVVRSVTPKPIRKARRAAITVRHPASSIEGAAKAGISRSVSRNRRRTRKNSSAGHGATAVGVMALVFLLLVIWGISAAYHALFPSTRLGVTPWVPGHVRFTSDGDYRTIRVSHVRCRWNGSRVQVQLLVTNKTGRGIALTVSPQYTLADHGSHGGSIGDYTDVGVRRRATKRVTVTAGQADGVNGQPAISSCGPDLVGLASW